jgi:hypothetical protein
VPANVLSVGPEGLEPAVFHSWLPPSPLFSRYRSVGSVAG